MAPARVIRVDRDTSLRHLGLGLFDTAIDPFADLYLERCVEVLGQSGRYVTCGIQAQDRAFAVTTADLPLTHLVGHMIMNNLSLIGNCIGTHEDLVAAVEDFDPSRPPLPIDSVHEPEGVEEFLQRTYGKGRRFGKVVMRYDGAHEGRGVEP